MRALKRLAVVTGALLALAGAVLALLAAALDGNWFKQELARLVLEEKGRNLRIDGDVDLSFLPTFGLRLGPASLSEPFSSREFAAVDGVRLAVRLLPLFSRQLVVERIELDGLRAKLVRHPDGTLNIADLLPGERQAQPVKFDIGEVRAARSALTYEDEKSGLILQLAELELKTGHLGNTTRGPVQLAATLIREGQRTALRFQGEYQFDLDRKRYGFSRLTGTVLPDAGRDSQLAVRLDASSLSLAEDGRIGLERLALGVQGQTAGGLGYKASGAGAVDGDLSGRRFRFPKLIGELEIEHPKLPEGRLVIPLEASLFADLAQPVAHANLAARLDGATLQAKGQIVALSPLRACFDVAIDSLDLDRYFSPGTELPPGAGQGGKEFSSFPSGVDLDGSIRIGHLRFQRAVLEGVGAAVRLRDGRLAADPAPTLPGCSTREAAGRQHGSRSFPGHGPRNSAAGTG